MIFINDRSQGMLNKNLITMKNSVNYFRTGLGILFAIICLQACMNDESLENGALELSQSEKLLNLKSPSGIVIALDVNSLRNEAAYIISERFGVDKEFELTSIDYLDVEGDGYAATINYCTTDGYEGSFVKLSNVTYQCANGVKQINFTSLNSLKSRSESGGGKDVTITCTKTGSCSCQGTCNCRPISKFENGIVTIGCGNCNKCVTRFYYN